MKCLITGGAGQVAYSLIPLIGNGLGFGHFQAVDLMLFDLPTHQKFLEGIKMEITVDPQEAFAGADVIIFLGAKPRTENMKRADLLKDNKKIFFEQAQLMDKFSKKDAKVLVVGNPCNTNALIVAETATSIPKDNITCLMRLDHNRVVAAISTHFGIPHSNISGTFVFGNHSITVTPSLSLMKIKEHTFVFDDYYHQWAKNEMTPALRSRGVQIIAHRGLSSSFSAAQAICQHLYDWYVGTEPHVIVSMGVVSDGSYNVPKGLVFGMPCRCLGNFKYEIIKDIELSRDIQDQIQISVLECNTEKDLAFAE